MTADGPKGAGDFAAWANGKRIEAQTREETLAEGLRLLAGGVLDALKAAVDVHQPLLPFGRYPADL